MTTLNPSMRLKVKGDTSFLPDANGSVYFRNNLVSFQMEGEMIDKWIEMLIPVFNGENTLEDLTDGLPEPHRDRLYEIAELLYQNGFIRDVSQDRPHQLKNQVLKKYASQIEFLDNLCGSGAYRFQTYRQAKVLAVGSGPFFVSLVAALFESGLSKFHMLITDTLPTNRQRLTELADHACISDPEVAVKEITLNRGGSAWQEAVLPYDSILYVSQTGDFEELKLLHSVCRVEKKMFLPAICIEQVGMAGPIVHPDSQGCWESAFRRLHKSALCKDSQNHIYSSPAGAMLANITAFELLKAVTGVTPSELDNKVFLLDLETMEGDWHTFLPHPAVSGHTSTEMIQDIEKQLGQNTTRNEPNRLFQVFTRLTSPKIGIFHIWDEGDLRQLPLAQCRVQAADPLSAGPAGLLPEIISPGLTHGEARREAGLSGIEAYISRMTHLLFKAPCSYAEEVRLEKEFVGIGAGETLAESICRGLQKCLSQEMYKQQTSRNFLVKRVRLSEIEDEHCRFYLRVLTAMQGEPVIGYGDGLFGFPAAWVRTGGRWYGSVSLSPTMALRNVLEYSLLKVQNNGAGPRAQGWEDSSVFLEDKTSLSLKIPHSKETAYSEILKSALQVLKRSGKRILIFDVAVEPFLKEARISVVGILMREEESR
ncbi:putative thiazole-containing bacteriocin maturation protein [Paenibacillus larvae]|uniref:Group-specific protein n=1 Tax=Paenibacillus larvae subsp. larvae TaxID=147375 RepID=A0A6C0QU13_9BACL|nr:putative thiazole-containing bacteriocin maturation protein [Paenibacillus larvae]QHZ51736.1 group-specific protein [Paenibacillus larvae subsp. larvae]